MKINKSKGKYWKAQGGFKLNVPGISANTMSLLNSPIGSAAGTAAAAANPWLLAAQLGLQVGTGLYGAYQQKQAQKQLADIEKTRPATSVGGYAEIAKRALESDASRIEQERMDRALATSLDALKYSPRGAAMVAPVLGQSLEAGQRSMARREDLQMQALQQLAGAEERALGREEERYLRKLGQAEALAGAGVQNIAGAITGAGEDVFKYGYLKGMGGQAIAGQAKDGAMLTKGAFNHKTNPIDIVQKGNKIGEMTGGEVILNPKQQKAVASQSPYFRSLLKKFNKRK